MTKFLENLYNWVEKPNFNNDNILINDKIFIKKDIFTQTHEIYKSIGIETDKQLENFQPLKLNSKIISNIISEPEEITYLDDYINHHPFLDAKKKKIELNSLNISLNEEKKKEELLKSISNDKPILGNKLLLKPDLNSSTPIKKGLNLGGGFKLKK